VYKIVVLKENPGEREYLEDLDASIRYRMVAVKGAGVETK
jgi:hypothetical protein